jgi:hypothetical protein
MLILKWVKNLQFLILLHISINLIVIDLGSHNKVEDTKPICEWKTKLRIPNSYIYIQIIVMSFVVLVLSILKL